MYYRILGPHDAERLCGVVEERSCSFEGEPEGSLEQQEVRMPA